jgi:hypothetical protein
MRRFLLPLLGLVAATPIMAQNERPPILVEESGRSFWRLDDAVRSIGPGRGTITIQPGVLQQCAVQGEGSVVYRAAKPGTVVLDGMTCDGKAALVLRGSFARVEGLIFQNMRVPDRNGSGIRLEKGDLEVENSIFKDSEQGILTNEGPDMNVKVNQSTFSGLGGCPDGVCSHSLYIGNNASLTVTNSRFEKGTGGHYLKSRAARSMIAGNSFDDTRGRTTNYHIDLPAGTSGSIINNVFVQGRDKENYSAIIALGAEDRIHPSAGLVISGNDASIAPGVDRQTTFVGDWTHEPFKMSNNRLGAGLKPSDRR